MQGQGRPRVGPRPPLFSFFPGDHKGPGGSRTPHCRPTRRAPVDFIPPRLPPRLGGPRRVAQFEDSKASLPVLPRETQMFPNAIPVLKGEPVRQAPSRGSPQGPRITPIPWGLHTIPSHRLRSSSSFLTSNIGDRPGRGLSGQTTAGPGAFPRPGSGEATRGPSASALRVAWRGGPRTAARRLPLRL